VQEGLDCANDFISLPNQVMAKAQYTAVSLFSGCGGSDVGMKQAGIESVWANDISESACNLYERVAARNVIQHQPVQTVERFPKADILAGCYPCQGYSQGGRRNPEDGLNFLYRDFDRALRQIKPLAFIVENVSGMKQQHNASLLRNQITRFRMAGYSVNYSVLDASHFGLPQRRKRIFIVGIRSAEKKKFQFPSPSHGPEATVPYRTMREAIWHFRDAPEGSFNSEPFHWYYLSRNRRHDWDDLAPCVVANWRHTALHPDSPPLYKVGKDEWQFETNEPARRFSYLECAALQGFPKPERFDVGKIEQRFTAIGNAVPPPLFAAVARQLVATIEGEA
jgi:DNA (cytosine-5)-methyltransferase 1